MKRPLILSFVFIAIFFIVGFRSLPEDSNLMKINKSLQIFGDIFRQISMNYVDEIEPEEFVRAGIDGMLSYLDPYTNYIPEDEGDEVDLLTTGRYGGFGVTVRTIDSVITLSGITEGFAADRAGLRVGDQLFMIDSVNVYKIPSDELRDYTRGNPGTPVTVSVLRGDTTGGFSYDTLTFSFKREEIVIKNVTFSGMLKNNIGYIRLERFSRNASSEVRQALDSLNKSQELRGLVLDLRGNPGGLLEAAVSITEMFIPPQSPIVTTRGRDIREQREYISRSIPINPTTNLAILINGRSASASEIVAGAVQDLDRGILVGERSFGKGLVQTISALPFGASLKMTTAKYYTPSGRCIQQIDYDGKRKGVVKSTSQSEDFRTKNGRKVLEGEGIYPDTLVSLKEKSPFVYALLDSNLFFFFANQYTASMNSLPDSFTVTKNLEKDFIRFVEKRGFNYADSALSHLQEAEEILQSSSYSKSVMKSLQEIERKITQEQKTLFSVNSKDIRTLLHQEILLRFKPEREALEFYLPTDVQVQTAVSLLNDNTIYARLTGDSADSKE